MKIKGASIALIFSVTLLSCATGRDSTWRPIEDHSKANISFKLAGKSLKRDIAKSMKTKNGWVETGLWKNEDGNNETLAWIYVYSLIDRVFTSDTMVDLKETIRSISGDGFITFDEKDQLNTGFGPVNIQYYDLSGLNCFFVESYWYESIIDRPESVLRNAGAGEYMVGDSLMQAFYCESKRSSFQFEDVEDFLQGIEVRGIYWPEDRFTEVEEQQ